MPLKYTGQRMKDGPKFSPVLKKMQKGGSKRKIRKSQHQPRPGLEKKCILSRFLIIRICRVTELQ
jgi:hypothetical protein